MFVERIFGGTTKTIGETATGYDKGILQAYNLEGFHKRQQNATNCRQIIVNARKNSESNMLYSMFT